MSLTVRRVHTERAKVTYCNGFIVELPYWVSTDGDRLIASELAYWLKQRVRREVSTIAADYGKRFGLVPRSLRVGDFANGWGSCGAEGNVLINWHLIFAPKRVLEYVVIHELAHLRHRSHGDDFWNFLARILPTFEQPKDWLDKNQGELSADFLSSTLRSD